jgi:hypothetical protein
MELNSLLNIIGLSFDIIGVIMLFKYGLPTDLNKSGATYKALEQIDKDAIIKYQKYDRYSKLALVIIIIGFLFQIMSNLN